MTLEHRHPQFLFAAETQLVVIDIQEKLFAAMAERGRENLLKNTPILLAAAGELGLPVAVTEQYPKGLGATIPELQEAIDGLPVFEKLDFAATEAADFVRHLQANGRRQVLLCGMETHICVYQTALGLRQLGFDVHLAADALASRTEDNYDIGLNLMLQAGCSVTSTETALFQWLERAGGASFKKLQKLII